ncbi:MAG: thioredoxin family protein, partial [Chloroherpetonaceae bacterium]
GWMNNIKVVMGFLEIAFALKFISNVDLVWGIGILPKDLFLAIWIGISLLITLYILGLFRFELDSPIEKVSTLRVTNAIIFAAITFYLMGGLFGRPLGELDAFLPPAEYQEIMNSGRNTNASIMNNNLKSNNNQNNNVNSNDDSKGITTKNNSVWLDNLQSGLELAKTSNQNVLLDFTGFTCTNCRWMEQNMFKKPEVQNLLDQMVKVRLFTDRYEEPYLSNKKFQQEKFGSIELPLYVILKPTGEVIATETFTRDYPEFLNFLRMGISTNL